MRVAEPEALKGTVPSGVPPSRKVTAPVGELPAATVATNVLACPYADELVDEVKLTVGLPTPMVKEIGMDWADT